MPNSKRAACTRFWTLAALVGLAWLMWGVHAYYTWEIQIEAGRSMKIKDAIRQFRRSATYTLLLQLFEQLWNNATTHGFSHSYQHAFRSLGAERKIQACQALGLDPGKPILLSELRHARNSLALLFHPDKLTTAEEKEAGANRFQELQLAYEFLLPYAVDDKPTTRQQSHPRPSSSASSAQDSVPPTPPAAAAASARDRTKPAQNAPPSSNSGGSKRTTSKASPR